MSWSSGFRGLDEVQFSLESWINCVVASKSFVSFIIQSHLSCVLLSSKLFLCILKTVALVNQAFTERH